MSRTNYKTLPLRQIAQQYIDGWSLNALAKKYEVGDHKTLGRHIKPFVEELGGRMRSHAESQGQRRENEWRGRDVRNWYDPALGHVTGPDSRATRS